MPNHAHLILHPIRKIRMGIVIGELKSLVARKVIKQWRLSKNKILKKLEKEINGNKKYVFWYPRCYDHNCRTNKTVIEKINYCHYNPVRANLVSDPKDWKWSSYNNYYGKDKDSAIEVNCIQI